MPVLCCPRQSQIWALDLCSLRFILRQEAKDIRKKIDLATLLRKMTKAVLAFEYPPGALATIVC